MLCRSLGALTFVYLIFVLNPIQMASALLFPFARRTFRNINRWCARSIWGLWVMMSEGPLRVDVRFFGDEIRQRENALLLPNHQSMADVVVLMCFAWRARRLGDMKWFVKDVIKYFPGVGWGMRFLDCVFVKRDWARDRAGIERLFGRYRKEQIPVFLVSFLEGTRKTNENLAVAREFAAERGLQVPEHVLVPRVKGLCAMMVGLREHLDCVYDITIGYPDGTPTLGSLFNGEPKRVLVHVRRFAVRTMPTEEAELGQWAFERYRQKDALLSRMHETGTFEGPEHESTIRNSDWFLSEARS